MDKVLIFRIMSSQFLDPYVNHPSLLPQPSTRLCLFDLHLWFFGYFSFFTDFWWPRLSIVWVKTSNCQLMENEFRHSSILISSIFDTMIWFMILSIFFIFIIRFNSSLNTQSCIKGLSVYEPFGQPGYSMCWNYF